MAEMTKCILLDVPIEGDYSHTLYFTSKTEQYNYFYSKRKKEYLDFSYQRKDKTIRVPEHIDALHAAGCNYVMYQNPSYPGKWFYAFISKMEYSNPEKTVLQIETDVLQTWLFDITINPCFVEREHTADDTVGANTYPEGLECGEYICNSVSKDSELTEMRYVIQTTEFIGGEKPLATNYGGVFSAGGGYICSTMGEVVNIIQALASADGAVEAVISVYMVPAKIINDSTDDLQYSGQTDPVKYTKTIAKPTTINGYTPRNNKLKTFPYCYLVESNNAGSQNILQFEHFSGSSCSFEVSGVPVPGGSIKLTPKAYKGATLNYDEGIMCGKFPTLSWSADMYTNWLTQNSVNIGLGIAAGAFQVVGGLATAAMTGGLGAAAGVATASSGFNSIVGTLAQIHQQAMVPNSARGNTNGGDINTSDDVNTFFFYSMSIKKEYAMIIDDFFDMYGYKCNRVKVPAKNHRAAYWYTKTIEANITGAVPEDDMQKIKDCYNKGITFWKDHTNFRKYGAVPNTIV